MLGCHLDGSGSTETLVQRRLEQGRKMFGKTRSLLSCPKIPEEERLRTFYSTVVPCVLWGSGCWIPSAKIQQLLSFQENRWLRCMLGGRKTQDVAWVDWFRTTKRITHALRSGLNHREGGCGIQLAVEVACVVGHFGSRATLPAS